MVVHEECAFRPLETLDFPSPLVELLDTYFPASLQPSTLQLLGWKVAESAAVSRFHRSRSHRRRPGLSTSSRRDVSIIVAKRGATTSFGYRTIFFVSRCTIGSPLRFNLTLNSGRICIRFAARPKRDEVRRRDLVKGDFTIISPLSLEDSAAENRSRISYGYITDATRVHGFACPLRLSCIFNAVLLLVASSTNTASSKGCRFKLEDSANLFRPLSIRLEFFKNSNRIETRSSSAYTFQLASTSYR